MSKVKVLLTMFEHAIEVEEHELPFLRAQGLVADDGGPDGAGVPAVTGSPDKPGDAGAAADPDPSTTRAAKAAAVSGSENA